MSVVRPRYFVPAVLFLGLAVSFRFDHSGAAWLWAGQPWVAVIVLLFSAAFWILLLRDVRRRHTADVGSTSLKWVLGFARSRRASTSANRRYRWSNHDH